MRQPQHHTTSKLLTVLFVLLVLPISILMLQYARRVQGVASATSYPIYDGTLAAGWEDWSWASHVNFANPSPVYSGTTSIAFTPTRMWAGLYLHTDTAVDISPYTFLHFAARASQSGQAYNVMLYGAANQGLPQVRLAHYGGNPVRGSWKVYNIPLADLRAPATQIRGIALQSRTPRRGTLYLASLSFTGSTSSLTPTPALISTPDPTGPTSSLTPTPALISTPDPTGTADPAGTGNTYYVSKNGSNADGKSWQTAWNELNQINWSVIQPGDTILLDGGSTSMTYTTTLTIGKSGTQTAPVTIKRATDTGHNGKVVFFGGRSTPLPYCGQSSYTYQPATTDNGIVFNGNSWIVIDGMNWHGISIYGFNANGVNMTDGGTPSNDTLRNLEVYDVGTAAQRGGEWNPTGGEGVYPSGSNLTFEQLDIHDNGDDEFNSGSGGPTHGGAVTNVTINRSWMHVTREDPRTSGLPFNDCIHQDGYQIWDGGVSSGLLIENSIVGPGLGDNLILGQGLIGGVSATVNNVTLQNDLVLGRTRSILGYDQVKETGWNIDHVTDVTFGDNTIVSNALAFEGYNNSVTNSIFYSALSAQGQVWLPDGLSNATGNCSWQTWWANPSYAGQQVDPKFVTDISGFSGSTPLTTLANADYSLQPSSPCKGAGSSITSVAQLLSMVNS